MVIKVLNKSMKYEFFEDLNKKVVLILAYNSPFYPYYLT
jgi:hypothetical protein